MSRIFISHASKDNLITEDIRQRLEAVGVSLFLDFHREEGIAAGEDWEKSLYRGLENCDAMIIVCSDSSMASMWCFAEVVHAKSMGKTVIPILIEKCKIHGILNRHHRIDWWKDADEAWERLKVGLHNAGVDLSNPEKWDPEKGPPYRGLLSFEEQDAAIFFGREDEIQQGQEILNRNRQRDVIRSLLVIGPSGSGKSSLVKAGIVPRLRRNNLDWVILDVMRPGANPMRELKKSLENTFMALATDSSSNTDEIQLDDAKGFCQTLDRLLSLAGEHDAKVLLVIDQAEELLSDKSEGAESSADQFFDLVLAALALDDCVLHTIWTLRSDFQSEFTPRLRGAGLDFTLMHLGLMDRPDLLQAIEKPARLANVRLAPGLAEKMIDDTPHESGLPLLAFTLRALYDEGHDDGLLDQKEYNDLGGLNGALSSIAEKIYAGLSSQEQAELPELFLSMARLEQNGRLSSRPIQRGSIKPSLDKVVDQFLDGQLLEAVDGDGGGTLEVAHEQLFKAWGRMQSWLDHKRDHLLWNRRLDYAVCEWEEADKADHLLMGGKTLDAAENHLEAHPEPPLAGEHLAFFEASREAKRKRVEARLEEQRQREEEERQKIEAGRRKKRNTIVLAALMVVLGVITGVFYFEDQKLKRELYVADVTGLAELQTDPLTTSLMLSSLGLDDITPFSVQVAINVAQYPVPLRIMQDHTKSVYSIACSPDGRRVVSSSADLTARVWTLGEGDEAQPVIKLAHHEKMLNGASFSADGQNIVSWSDDGKVYIQPADGAGDQVLAAVHQWEVRFTQARPKDASTLLVADKYGAVSIWSVDGAGSTGDICQDIPWQAAVADTGSACYIRTLSVADGTEITSASFSPDGRYIVASNSKGIRLWNAGDYSEYDVKQFHADAVLKAVFGPLDEQGNSTRLVTTSKDNTAAVWDLKTLETLQQVADPLPLTAHTDWVRGAAFSPDGKRLITFSKDQSAIYWNLDAPENRVVLSHSDDLISSSFSESNRYIVTISHETLARVWEVDSLEARLENPSLDSRQEQPMLLLQGHGEYASDAVFCGKDNFLVTASADATVRLWNLNWVAEPVVLPFENTGNTPATDIDYNADGELVAVAFKCPARSKTCSPAASQLLNMETGDEKELGNARSVSFMPAEATKYKNAVLTVALEGFGEKNFSPVQLWPDEGREPVRIMKNNPDELVSTAIFSPDGSKFITAEHNGIAKVWDLDGKQLDCCESMGKGTLYAEFSHDGNRVVTAMFSENTSIVGHSTNPDSPSAKPTSSVKLGKHRLAVNKAVFSPDDKYVATASSDNTVRLSSVDGTDREKVFTGHTGRVLSIAFSRDGKLMVSASVDGEARIWNTDGSGESIRLKADGSPINDAEFNPAGTRVITASDDGKVRVWRFLWEDLLAYMENSTSACLTSDQRIELLHEDEAEADENFKLCEGP